MVFNGGAYYSEAWYEEQHPFVWANTMDCERVSAHVAEYIGKRLIGSRRSSPATPSWPSRSASSAPTCRRTSSTGTAST